MVCRFERKSRRGGISVTDHNYGDRVSSMAAVARSSASPDWMQQQTWQFSSINRERGCELCCEGDDLNWEASGTSDG